LACRGEFHVCLADGRGKAPLSRSWEASGKVKSRVRVIRLLRRRSILKAAITDAVAMLEFRKDIFADERDDNLVEIAVRRNGRICSGTSQAPRRFTTIIGSPTFSI
jgi:hypothetical protein